MNRGLAALLLAGIAGCAPRQPADVTPAVAPADSSAPRGARFYRGRPYGSESQFNPLSVVINEGFDQLRTEGANRRVFELDYGRAATNVLHSLGNAPEAIRRYGVGEWIRSELLPLSGKGSGGGQWVPNYQLHLLSGGMTGVRITEWYQQHGVPHPELAALGTAFGWHLLNEMIEHQSGDGRNVDAITDLAIFDVAAFLLWRNDRVQRFVSDHVEMTNWPGQPSVAFPGRTLQNMHQTAMVRYRARGDWRPMTTMGGSFLIGLSRRRHEDRWLTLAGGWDPSENPVIDPVTGRQTVVLNPNVGLFYDRDGSLLVSLVVRANRSERMLLNVHPGLVRVGTWSPGFWAQSVSGGGLRFGLASPWGIGVGRDRPPGRK